MIGRSAVFMVMELEHVIGGAREGVHLLISRAGHDDVMDLQWPGPHGVLTPSMLEDLLATIGRLATANVVAFCGVQGDLPLG